MYRVLLVDDETIVLEGLSNVVDWKGFGCEVCAKATSAEEGMELIKLYHPDIIFTDIRMKQMSGLEMLENVCDEIRNSKVVIITGYRDFEYAQKAIALGVSDFVIKPTKLNELNEIIGRLVSQLDKEARVNTEISRLKEDLSKIRSEYTENVISNLLLSENDMTDKEAYHVFASIGFGEYFIFTASVAGRTMQKEIKTKLKNVLESILPDEMNIFIIQSGFENELSVIVFMDDGFVLEDTQKYNALDKICGCLEKIYPDKINIGVSTMGKELDEVKTKYLESHQALEYRFYMQCSPIIFYSDLPDIMPDFKESDMQYSDLLIDAVITGNSDVFRRCWNTISQYIESIPSITDIRRFVIETVMKLYDTYGKINNQETVHNPYSVADMVEKCTDKDVCMDFLMDICDNMVKKVYNYNDSHILSKLKKAIEYIEHNFSLPITRNDVADCINVSPNYVSALFKKELNMTLVEFINKTRIEHAKEMLLKTDKKLYEIAVENGFSDVYYFSKIFKSYSGKSPGEWRKQR